jgi:lipopolysaccharide transport system ATP-binding protein
LPRIAMKTQRSSASARDVDLDAAQPALVSLRGVGVSYWRRKGQFGRSRFWALRDVSFDLFRGDSLGVIGRNGAGKSTLLRLLGGIIDADRGEIEKRHRQSSLLSLQAGFLPHLTGRENATLSGMLLGLTREAIEREMDAVIEFSELGDFIDEPLYTYSSGMRARLGFSVAFRVDPEVLLIDEVLGVGDAEFKQKSVRAMREKLRSNRTIVVTSHSLGTIRDLCNRAVWIEQGESRAEGDAESVVQAYREWLSKTAGARVREI